MNKPEPNTVYKVDGDKTYHTDNPPDQLRLKQPLALVRKTGMVISNVRRVSVAIRDEGTFNSQYL